MEGQPAVDPGDHPAGHGVGDGQRRGEQVAHERVAPHEHEPAGHVEARGGDGHHAAEPVALGRPQSGAAAERVAYRYRALAGVRQRGVHERVELLEDGPVAERVGGAEAGHVERQGGPTLAAEPVEQQPPGVGAVGPAVEQQQRRPLALELQRACPVPRELQPVLEQRLHAAILGQLRTAPGLV